MTGCVIPVGGAGPRLERRRPAVPVPAHGLDDLIARPPDPVAAVDTRLDLWAALLRLPEQQRLPIVLVDWLGYPVAEAAATLGLPVGTVKSRCARGRDRLHAWLAPAHHDVEEAAR
jgi:RNA polymerase sigma-70 factor, ECF subfamily